MNCPYCHSLKTKQRSAKTSLGYRTHRCQRCRRTFNERTGTPFNYLEYPTDSVLLVVFYRLRYKLSLRDLAEIFLERGFTFTHETVRNWEARFAPLITDQLRMRRHGQTGASWHVDETYVRVQGKWHYLYRAIDQDGNLVDSMLSQKRDMDAAQRFFHQALQTVDHAPEKVTTDGHRCNGYLGYLFEKKALWTGVARLFLSVRWNTAIDPEGNHSRPSKKTPV
jgi:putative transposase